MSKFWSCVSTIKFHWNILCCSREEKLKFPVISFIRTHIYFSETKSDFSTKFNWSSIEIVCLFICLFARRSCPIENFSLMWRGHHYCWRAANFYPFSTHMAIEQSQFSSVPHLLWHRPAVYNGHLRGPVTLTPVAKHLAVETGFNDVGLSRNIKVHPTHLSNICMLE